jgi:PPOX class probable F420-dependent enzyme
MRTAAHTHKVKRIQNNPNVRAAPSTFRGEIKGEWVEGEARVYDAADMQWVNALSKRRHTWFKRLIDLRNRFRDVQFVVIEVRLDSET